MPGARDTAALNPAGRYYLMAGVPPHGRCHGWVEFFQTWWTSEDASLRRAAAAAWREYSGPLIAEATRAGFVPWMASKKRPSGPAFTAWERRFYTEYGY